MINSSIDSPLLSSGRNPNLFSQFLANGERDKSDLGKLARVSQTLAVDATTELVRRASPSARKELLGTSVLSEIGIAASASPKDLYVVVGETRRLAPFRSMVSKYGEYAPALINRSSEDNSGVSLTNCFNAFINEGSISGTPSFTLGHNVSLVIKKHKIELMINHNDKIEKLSYKIPFAFILSFGDKIGPHNIFQTIESLWAFALKGEKRMSGN